MIIFYIVVIFLIAINIEDGAFSTFVLQKLFIVSNLSNCLKNFTKILQTFSFKAFITALLVFFPYPYFSYRWPNFVRPTRSKSFSKLLFQRLFLPHCNLYLLIVTWMISIVVFMNCLQINSQNINILIITNYINTTLLGLSTDITQNPFYFSTSLGFWNAGKAFSRKRIKNQA